MSYFVCFIFKNKPTESCLSKLQSTECRVGKLVDLCLKKLGDNVYFIGDGHSSQSVIKSVDLKNKGVFLYSDVLVFFECCHDAGCYPSIVISYCDGKPINVLEVAKKNKLFKGDLTSETVLEENVRYYIGE